MDKYLDYVREEAIRMGKVFFIDSGEGRTWGEPDGEWFVEDLTGWLVAPEHAAAFAPLREAKDEVIWDKPWSDMYCVVRWELASSPSPEAPPIAVRFRYPPDYLHPIHPGVAPPHGFRECGIVGDEPVPGGWEAL